MRKWWIIRAIGILVILSEVVWEGSCMDLV